MISVLVVDDESAFLDLCKLFLERSGDLSVDTLLSPLHAIEQIKTREYDVVVSDYLMPEMDGISFLRNIRERYGDIPFIILTGKGREEVVIEALNCGADFYLQKGGHVREQFGDLERRIRQIVTQRRSGLASREYSALLRDVLDTSDEGILVVDNRGKIIDFNRRFIEIWGVPENILELRDEHATLAFTMSRLKNPHLLLARVQELASDPGRSSRDLVLFQDGRVIERISCPRLNGKSVSGRIWRFRDITPLAHMQDEINLLRDRLAEYETFSTPENQAGTVPNKNNLYHSGQ